MTDQPRIFVSAVSCEFASARKQVADILTRLDCEAVWQEISGTEAGDLRPVLREKIRSCDALLQIVGVAYGPERSVPDEKFGRVSYTQFEYLVARKLKKKTWLIFASEAYDSAQSRFDVPPDPAIPIGKATRSSARSCRSSIAKDCRRRAVPNWRRRMIRKSDPRSNGWPTNSTDCARRVSRQQRGKKGLAAAAVLLVAAALLGGGWTAIRAYNNRLVASALASLDSDQIRGQLEKSIRQAYDRQAADAQKGPDPEGRQKAIRQADQVRDQELLQLATTVAFIRGTIVRGQASPEFLEMSRLLQAQGVDAALAYLSSQEPRLLANSDQWKGMQPRELEWTLAPVLGETVLYRQRGDLPAAGRLCERLLIGDTDWPDARFQLATTMMALAGTGAAGPAPVGRLAAIRRAEFRGSTAAVGAN